MDKRTPLAETLAKELGYKNAKELRQALAARESGDYAQDVKMRLESGQGFKEAFGGATKAKIASVKRTFSKQGLKDFGKDFKKEFFSGNDIFSAYARGKMRKKEKTEEEEVEDTGATLSKDAVTYLRIIAKNSISLHGMARDVNVLRRNIVELVKLKGGKKTAKEKKERFGGKADEFFKTSDEKEAMLEAERKKDTKPKPVEKEKKEEKKEEGGGFLDSIINFFKDGLLGSLASLFNPAAILKILGKVFVIATIFISLFKGITAAFDKWKETGSLKEAIISGLGAIVDFLTFGFFGEDTVRNLFNKVSEFMDPIIDSFKKVYYSVKDWIANNIGIPQFGPWNILGKQIGPIGPWYPFKDDPSSSAEQKTVIPETPKPEGKGGESGGGGATGGWDETKKTENEKAGNVTLISGTSLKLPEGVNYDSNSGNFMYKGITFNAGDQKELDAIVKAIDNRSVIQYQGKDDSGGNVIRSFDGATGQTGIVSTGEAKTPTPTSTETTGNISSGSGGGGETSPTSAGGSSGSAGSDGAAGASGAGGASGASGAAGAGGAEGAAGADGMVNGPSAQSVSPTEEANSAESQSTSGPMTGSSIMQQSSDVAEEQRMESSADSGTTINSPTTNNNSSQGGDEKPSSIVDVYDQEIAKRLLAA